MSERLHIVLVRPEIPWNAGNVGRTCLAVGARLHLVEPLGFDLDARQVRRAGLDYWPRVAPRVWPDWENFAAGLEDLGDAFLFTARGRAGALDLWEVRFPDPAVLVFGPESSGLPERLLGQMPERVVRVPVTDDVRSLNLASAVAVAAYEVLRQWKTGAR